MAADVEDAVIFPELEVGSQLWFYCDDQGFVYEALGVPSDEELAEAFDDDGWGGDDDSSDSSDSEQEG